MIFSKEHIKKSFPRAATCLSYLRHRSPAKLVRMSGGECSSLVQSIRKYGYVLRPDFLSRSACDAMRSRIQALMEQQEEQIQIRSDKRFFGIEKFDQEIMAFHLNSEAQKIASAVNLAPSSAAFTLAGWLNTVDGSSGEGWHRDGFLSQFKAMVYLTDVGEDNGPFEILEKSHQLRHILRDMGAADLDFSQYRLPDEQVRILIDKGYYQPRLLTAKAGTLVYFDSSSIHRGSPMKAGERMSLTTYFFENTRIGPELFRQFNMT